MPKGTTSDALEIVRSNYSIEKELLLNYLQNPEDSTIRQKLFDEISKGYATYADKMITTIKSANSNPAFQVSESMKELRQFNENNIIKIVETIHAEGWDIEWDNAMIYEPSFGAISSIPVYLPNIFPDILSGEYFLYLVHSEKMYFSPLEVGSGEYSDAGELTSTDKYRRQYQRGKGKGQDEASKRNSVIGQMNRELFLSLDNLPWKKGSALWNMINLYSFVEYFSPPRNGNTPSKKHGVKPLFNILDMPTNEILSMLSAPTMDEVSKKMMLFKTLLFQSMTEEQQIEIYLYERDFKWHIKFVEYYLESFIWMPILTFKFYVEKSNKYRNTYDAMWEEIREYTQKYGKSHDSVDSPITPSEDNLYKIILWKILAREHKSYCRYLKKIKSLICSFPKLSNTQLVAYRALPLGEEICVNTSRKFFNKYNKLMDTLFPDLCYEERKKMWDMSIKILLYWHPHRFNFTFEKTNPYRHPKTLTPSYLKEENVNLLDVRLGEVVPLMLFLSWIEKATDHDKTLYRTLDNMRVNCTPMLVKEIRSYYEGNMQLTLVDAIEIQRYVNLWRLTLEKVENGLTFPSMQDETKLLLDVRSLLMDIASLVLCAIPNKLN